MAASQSCSGSLGVLRTSSHLAKADTSFDEDSETFRPFPIEHVARPDRRLLRVGREAPV